MSEKPHIPKVIPVDPPQHWASSPYETRLRVLADIWLTVPERPSDLETGPSREEVTIAIFRTLDAEAVGSQKEAT